MKSRGPAFAFIITAIAITIAHDRAAHACGVSASGAPAGICDASDVVDEKLAAFKNRIGVSYGYTSSIIFFSDGYRAPTERHAVMASFEHPFKGHWTLEVGAGSLLGGTLGTATFSPGILAGVSLSHVLIESHGYARPFLLASIAFATVYAQTTEQISAATSTYIAMDFSVAAAAGVGLKAGKQTLTPFLAGRLFGGPIFWAHGDSNVLGTDAFKYALGPGFAVQIQRYVSVSVGSSVFGEKNLRGGVSVSFP